MTVARRASLTVWLLVTGAAGAVAQPVPAGKAAAIVELQWLEGTWVSETAGTRIEEHWTPPAGGGMLGTSRTVRGERMVGFEFLRIVARDHTLVYVAQPGGQASTEFTLTAAGPGLAVFENPAHDFPQRLHYRRSGPTLEVELDGVEGGTPARASYTFTRAGGKRN